MTTDPQRRLYQRLHARKRREERRKEREHRPLILSYGTKGLPGRKAGLIPGILYRVRQHPSGALILRPDPDQSGFTARCRADGHLSLNLPEGRYAVTCSTDTYPPTFTVLRAEGGDHPDYRKDAR